MRKVYKKRDEEGVSPVIATILMVAITVVLAAVLYVMVIGMGGDGGTIETPLGLNQQAKTTTSVTILVSSAPTGARVYSTSVALTQGGVPVALTAGDVEVYSAAGVLMATNNPASVGLWDYEVGYTGDNTLFAAGATIRISSTTISAGDRIVLSSADAYFGTTTFTVS